MKYCDNGNPVVEDAERKAMINRESKVSVMRQCELLDTLRVGLRQDPTEGGHIGQTARPQKHQREHNGWRAQKWD